MGQTWQAAVGRFLLCLAMFGQQMARDNHPHDFIGTFQNLVNPQVAHQFFDAVIRKIAIATMQLQTLINNFGASLGHKLLCHGAMLAGIGRPLIKLPCGLAQENAGRLQFDLHISKAELKPLKLIDGFAESLAL